MSGSKRQSGHAGARAGLALAAMLVTTLVTVAPADAYVRYLTKETQVPFHWNESCVLMTGYPKGMPGMTPDQVNAATSLAAAVWGSAALPCTYMDIDITMSSGTPRAVANDGYNSLIFRADSWCNPSKSGVCKYDSSALAITSVFVTEKEGRILDGDIEVNAVYFVWDNLNETTPAEDRQDLQNALTHELGHLIGLDHTCYDQNPDRTRPTDHLGQPVPNCTSAPAAIRATTMFASAIGGDVSKRTLTEDDQLAVCETYPSASDPQTCGIMIRPPTETGGCDCAVSAGADANGPGLALLVGMMLIASGRRHRRPW